MKRLVSLALLIGAIALAGCTRIGNGEVGLRQNFNKTIEANELQAGSLNQTLIGDVLVFKVQDVGVSVDNLTPQAADNAALKDFDATAIYSINPKAVSDIWTTKNRAFHTVDEHNDIMLMNGYVKQVLQNASFKAVRAYESLKLNDNRSQIESAIKEGMQAMLREEHLDTSIVVSQVQVRTMAPADSIVESANALVRAKNELATKTVEVQTAAKEAERIAALNANSKAIDYMNAQANLKIAEGIASGRVHTIVVPFDFKGIVNTASK